MIVVIATENELALARKYYPTAKVVISGVGGLNVIKALQAFPRDTEIVNIGYVGSNILQIGSVVDVSRCSLYHPNVEYKEPHFKLGGVDNITCYTACDFVLDTDIKAPCVFDMELAFILALGFENVKSIKVVSDNLNYEEYEENTL